MYNERRGKVNLNKMPIEKNWHLLWKISLPVDDQSIKHENCTFFLQYERSVQGKGVDSEQNTNERISNGMEGL